ncbi:putative membrane protein [Borreliella bissettiae DN127]|uniref:Membrane protein n=1 Tax=Borrelia bissettiae (strain DSM 17990 / CIP 109136 / DN127) TaxID=521010 RepID=G0AM25_BORBD|nr:putative membrane protein [Borreliella bissettiae DN127]
MSMGSSVIYLVLIKILMILVNPKFILNADLKAISFVLL